MNFNRTCVLMVLLAHVNVLAACPLKVWQQGVWEESDQSAVFQAPATQVMVTKASTRFKSGGKWFLTNPACGRTLTVAKVGKSGRSPASVAGKSLQTENLSQPKSTTTHIRLGLEYSGISRSLGIGGQEFALSGNSVGVRAGVGRQKHLGSEAFWGFGGDVFLGASSIAADVNAPVIYNGSSLMTGSVRAGMNLGRSFRDRWYGEVQFGVGVSYLKLQATGLAGVTEPNSLSVFPQFSLATQYKASRETALRFELISQGIAKDFAVVGGVQWEI